MAAVRSLILFALGTSTHQSIDGATSAVLTNIAAIKQRSGKEFAAHIPVHLRAVVTCNSGDNVYSIQDETAAIFIEAPGSRLPGRPGDIVEVRGVATSTTGYAPAVIDPKVHVVGKSRLPDPRHLSFERLASGASDGLFVTLSGLVRAASAVGGALVLRFDTGGEIVNVYVPDMAPAELDSLIAARLRIDAVCSNLFNRNNQLTGVEFYVPERRNITVLARPAGDPFLSTPVAITSLLRFGSAEALHSKRPGTFARGGHLRRPENDLSLG